MNTSLIIEATTFYSLSFCSLWLKRKEKTPTGDGVRFYRMSLNFYTIALPMLFPVLVETGMFRHCSDNVYKNQKL